VTPSGAGSPPGERVQKVLAAAGLGSRRALEQQIRAGAVIVNGHPATLGQSVQIGDRVRVGDRQWTVTSSRVRHRTLFYNKPEGEVTTRADEAGRPTVFDRLPPAGDSRWVAIGRLDIATTGLLILTTDGELAHAMMHPSNQVDREYVCRVRGTVSDGQIAALLAGVQLEDGPARFTDVARIGGAVSNPWFQVTLLEGRNREVRRLWESQGHAVSRLKRVRYGAAMLPRGLRVGHWAEITAAEHRVLREDVGLPAAAAQLALQSCGPTRGKRPPQRRKREKRGR
jgi:23S rRNA pseudouridine2605 synthase